MYSYHFDIDIPLKYELTGKFKSPSPLWQHEVFPLWDYELFIITEGTLYIQDHSGQYEVKKGNHLLLAPTPHNMRSGYAPSDCSFYWLHFSYHKNLLRIDSKESHQQEALQETNLYSSGINMCNTTNQKQLQIPQQGQIPSLEKVIILLKQLQDSKRSNYDQTFLDYTTTIVLCELHNQFSSKNHLITNDMKRQIYNDILDYIRLTLTRNVKVSEIADHFGYNEKYLTHLFSTLEGLPLKQYILKEKMALAKYLLTDTNDSINQIAEHLSFSDNHNFMKTFKRVVGMTPSEYRNAFNKRLLYDR